MTSGKSIDIDTNYIPIVLASLEVINVVHLDRFHNFTSVILNNFIVQVS